MAHIHTIVRVKAESEEEAIERVNNLLTNNGEYNHPSPFDWFSEEDTKISEECKSDEDYLKLRAEEIKESKYNLEQSEKQTTDSMRGFYLMRAGESLYSEMFWSTERLAYDLDWEDGKNTYYVETDRHY